MKRKKIAVLANVAKEHGLRMSKKLVIKILEGTLKVNQFQNSNIITIIRPLYWLVELRISNCTLEFTSGLHFQYL